MWVSPHERVSLSAPCYRTVCVSSTLIALMEREEEGETQLSPSSVLVYTLIGTMFNER